MGKPSSRWADGALWKPAVSWLDSALAVHLCLWLGHCQACSWLGRLGPRDGACQS